MLRETKEGTHSDYEHKTNALFPISHRSHSLSFFLPPADPVWSTPPAANINLYAETDNVKRKIGIPIKNSGY
jgi:hypothetical protein